MIDELKQIWLISDYRLLFNHIISIKYYEHSPMISYGPLTSFCCYIAHIARYFLGAEWIRHFNNPNFLNKYYGDIGKHGNYW